MSKLMIIYLLFASAGVLAFLIWVFRCHYLYRKVLEEKYKHLKSLRLYCTRCSNILALINMNICEKSPAWLSNNKCTVVFGARVLVIAMTACVTSVASSICTFALTTRR